MFLLKSRVFSYNIPASSFKYGWGKNVTVPKTLRLLVVIVIGFLASNTARASEFEFIPIFEKDFELTAETVLEPRKLGLYGEKFCNVPGFQCIFIKKIVSDAEVERRDKDGKTVKEKKAVTEYFVVNLSTFVEMRFDFLPTWEALWSDPVRRDIVMHVNRMNVSLRSGVIIAVPENLEGKTRMDFSPFPLIIDPPGEKLIIWDPLLLAFSAYEADGKLVRWGAAVGGMDKCPEKALGGRSCRTITGTFRILAKYGPKHRSSIYPLDENGGRCKGAKCAFVPYFMLFNDLGYGFHVSEESPTLKIGGLPGKNASHGCVRLFREDGMWLNLDFVDAPSMESKGTKVIIRPYPN